LAALSGLQSESDGFPGGREKNRNIAAYLSQKFGTIEVNWWYSISRHIVPEEKLMKKIAALPFILVILCFSSFGQVATGGTFSLDQSVIAGGGGSSTGGTFSLIGTVGQDAAGTTSTGGSFALTDGFWQAAALAPTAAEVTVGGRVLSSLNAAIPRAIVTFTGADGVTHAAVTNNFGFYTITGLQAGQTYLITVSARRYIFAPQAVSVVDNLTGYDLRML